LVNENLSLERNEWDKSSEPHYWKGLLFVFVRVCVFFFFFFKGERERWSWEREREGSIVVYSTAERAFFFPLSWKGCGHLFKLRERERERSINQFNTVVIVYRLMGSISLSLFIYWTIQVESSTLRSTVADLHDCWFLFFYSTEIAVCID
jgi:hypothetical protein